MSDILSQSEIEALLNSLETEAANEAGKGDKSVIKTSPTLDQPSPAKKRMAPKATVSYEVYDFRRPDKFSKDQLRTLQMLHETFARLAGSSLSAYLRAPVTIDLISLEQVPYEEYLRTINQSVFTIMSLPPLTGQAVLEIEFGLIFAMIDRMLGGPGKAVNRTNLTDIEKPLVRQTIERMFQSLKSAWEGVVIVNPGIEGMETSPQFVQIAPPTDIVVTILFEVKIGGQRNAMSLCVPYLILKPITTKLSAQKWFSSTNRKHSPQARRLLTQQVNQSQVVCSINLGKSKISFQDFVQLQAGDVLRLDQKVENELPMLVGNVPKFRGKPAIHGKHMVFAVTEAIEE